MNALYAWLARRMTPAVYWIALLLLCGAYLQGGLTKLYSFSDAITEMDGFGLEPAALFALLVILLELAAAIAILAGFQRALAALALAVFTLGATFLANRFWEVTPADRFMATNAFFEHLGLTGGFVLVAWQDLRNRESGKTS